MAEQTVVAYLYAATGTPGAEVATVAINSSHNQERYITSRRQRHALDSPQAHDERSGVEREKTEEPEEYDSLESIPGLEIALGTLPKGERGVEVGCDPLADIWIPNVPGVSYRHFSLTFNDDYFLVVKDLKSTAGTSVIYGDQVAGPFFDSEYVVAGPDFFRGDHQPIIIRATSRVQFRLVVEHFDPHSKEFRDQVDRYRAGSGKLDEIFEGIGIRAPTQLQTAAQTPNSENVQLMRKVGQGRSSVVHRVFGVKTGGQYALKEPLERYDIEAWKDRAASMRLVSHQHIVAFRGFTEEPRPALHLEYVPGGTLTRHLEAGKYFSESERVQVTSQTTSALAYLHGLEPPMAHRDISTNSIFVHQRDAHTIVVKLGDVGVPESGPQLDNMVGTPSHLSPELFDERTWDRQSILSQYTTAGDIWALGAVLAELVCGLPDPAKVYEGDGKLWCQAISRRLAEHFQKSKDPLAFFLLELMLRMRPEDRREAWDCHERSQLLRHGPPEAAETAETMDSQSEREGGESEGNEGDGDGSDDIDGSEAGTITETEPVGRDDPAHNMSALLTPDPTNVSMSGNSSEGTEMPRDSSRSDAPSPPSASQMAALYALVNEPTNSLFGESIFAESSVERSDLNDSNSDTPRSPSARAEPEAGTSNREMATSRELASTVPQKRTCEDSEHSEDGFRLLANFVRGPAESVAS